jgi:hypothetical protein
MPVKRGGPRLDAREFAEAELPEALFRISVLGWRVWRK